MTPPKAEPGLVVVGTAPAVALALALVVFMAACPQEPEVIPGDVKDVGLVVKIAALQQSELDTIGSFNLTLIHDGEVEREVPLSFSSSSRTLAFLDEPADLPTTGTLSAILEARDVLGQPIDIGGRSDTVELDALSADAPGTLFAVVSRMDASAPLGVSNRAGANVRAVGVGTGVVVVGDAGLQWIDLATGTDCLSTAADDACALGAAPPSSTADLVVTALSSLEARCAFRDHALLTQGTDAWLFDPGAVTLTKLTLALQPRGNAALVPTTNCRVLVAGGGSSTDIITFSGADIVAEPGPPIGFARGDEAAAATGNAIGEVLVVGGEGAAVVRTVGDVEVCNLDDDVCNGEAAAPACVRARPLAARVDDVGDLSPVLVFGGDCEAPEVFRSAADAPFGAFLVVDAPPVPRRDDATLTPIAGGALLAGGTDIEGGAATRNVSFFAIEALSATAASGTWQDLGELAADRSGHAAAVVGGAVVIVGGAGDDDAPIEVVVPAASLSSDLGVGGGT